MFVLMCVVWWGVVNGDGFPSLLTTNASLAIIVDKEFVSDEFEDIQKNIQTYMEIAKREILKHGGVNVFYYSWAAINVKNDFTAILSVASCSDTWKIFKSSQSEALLHMAISEADCSRLPPDQAVTIPIINRGDETPQLLLDLRTAKIYNWKSAVVLYDHKLINDDMITRIIRSLTKTVYYKDVQAAAVSLIKLESNDTASLLDIFSTIHTKVVGKNFLVFVRLQQIPEIMSIAKSLNLVNTKNQWLYIITNTNYAFLKVKSFKKLLKEGDNVAFIYNSTIIDDNCVGGRRCHIQEILEGFTRALEDAIVDEQEIAEQVSDEEWEAIRPSKSARRDYLLSKVKKHLVDRGTCGNCTFWKMKTGETWGREYEFHAKNKDIRESVRGDSVAEIFSVGTWRPSDSATMTDELFPHIAHGFRGKTLPMVSFHNPPWQILKTNSSGDVVEFGGLVFDIIKELSSNLNFTYTVEIANANINVTQFKNESKFIGLGLLEMADITTFTVPRKILEMVHNKTVAMGACAFTVTEENRRLINFTIPISIQPYTFLVARPRELSRALLFISPFRGDTWFCLAVAIVLMGPILYYIQKFSPVYEYKGLPSKGLSSIQNCIWYMYGALLQQGGMHLPYADSARIIVGSWWLVVLVVATTYCGNLVAFLTFPKIDVPITTLEELIAHKDTVTWSLIPDSYLESQIKKSREYEHKIIYERRTSIPDKSEMIQRIVNGKHVHIDWKIHLQYIMKKEFLRTYKCDLSLALDEFFEEQIALLVAPDTPYLARINEEIRKLHQVGLINKWLQDYLPKKDKCWKTKRSVEVQNHTVNINDMQGSFFVLFLGFILAVILILGEKCWARYIKKRKREVIQPFTS